jgi:2-phosphosulfolactate phosphatase
MSMQIEVVDFVAGARAARGVTVVIDVFRAFSVACYAFAGGVERMIPIGEIDKALALKRANPGWLAFGERYGKPLEGFDFGNSPTHIVEADLRGKTIVHTTHAGTQGLTNAQGADVVLTGSLVNAGAICRYISLLAPSRVTIVRMGTAGATRTDEDDVCAELLHARLSGQPYDVSGIRERLRRCSAAGKFFDPEATWAPERDFELCTDVDRFDFVLRLAARDEMYPYLEQVSVPPARPGTAINMRLR